MNKKLKEAFIIGFKKSATEDSDDPNIPEPIRQLLKEKVPGEPAMADHDRECDIY